MPNVIFQDLNRIDYAEAWAYQQKCLKTLVGRKRGNRQFRSEGRPLEPIEHYLLFCEHDPVYTLGKSGSMDHLLRSKKELAKDGFQFFKINRGGDITYHGPGQIVAYPIFDLDDFFTDVHRYVRSLEEVVIRTLAEYDISAQREEGYTGVWLPQTDVLPKRKICAIGVHLSRWVTMHGFAFNINTDLSHFGNIVPCGIAEDDKAVTTLSLELGQKIPLEVVKTKLKRHFADVFEFSYL